VRDPLRQIALRIQQAPAVVMREPSATIMRLPVPPNLELGRQLWGSNPEYARMMTQQMTQGSLRSMGVTREWISQWLHFYENEALRSARLGIENPSLHPRLDLLRRALELLGD